MDRQATFSSALPDLSHLATGAQFSFWASTAQDHLERLRSSSNAALHDISEIIPGKLFLGSRLAAQNQSLLKKLGVSHVVLVHHHLLPEFPDHFCYHVCRLADDFAGCILPKLVPALQFMREAMSHKKGRVLVHCTKGISRSSTIVAALLMADLKMDVDQAVRFIRTKRPVAYPNLGFQEQLRIFGTFLGNEQNNNNNNSNNHHFNIAKLSLPSEIPTLFLSIQSRLERSLDDTRSLVSSIFDLQHRKRATGVSAVSSGSTAASTADFEVSRPLNALRHTAPWAEVGLVYENLNAYRVSGYSLPAGESLLRRVASVAGLLDGLKAAFYAKLPGVIFASKLADEMRKWIDLSSLLATDTNQPTIELAECIPPPPRQNVGPSTPSPPSPPLGVCVNSLFRLGPDEPEDIALEIQLGHGTAMPEPEIDHRRLSLRKLSEKFSENFAKCRDVISSDRRQQRCQDSRGGSDHRKKRNLG